MREPNNLSTLSIIHENVQANAAIACAVSNACKIAWEVPDDIVSVSVIDGWVTLEGELDWMYQSDAAVNAVMKIDGVRGVNNHITIKSGTAESTDIGLQYD